MNDARFGFSVGIILVLALSVAAIGQQSSSAATSATPQLPRLVKFSGTLKEINGNPLSGFVGVTFALYSEPSGGAPLWLETQNVQPDKNGHYTVMLGATKSDGMPVELFASEQAQWLAVQPEGQAEQPRVMLVNVPYALKAVDAETLGGKPASAYALATPQTETSAPAGESPKANAAISPSNNGQSAIQNQGSVQAATTGSGTMNYIPRWTSSSALGNSNIFQNATDHDIGIGTTTPTATLDVKGTTLLSGSSATAFGLTVTSPAQFGEEIQGPITGVGAGLDFKTTGMGGKQWEILATGNTASQGVGKLNIRDVNTGTDVFTVDAADLVHVDVGLVVPGTTSTNFLTANVAGIGSFGVTSLGPVGVGPEFTTKSAAANLDVQGYALDTLIGDPGCGPNFTGIGFQNSGLTNCTNYALIGDTSGNTYLNSSNSGAIHLRNNNGGPSGPDQMTITSAGNVGVGNNSPLEVLDVAGRVRSQNLAATAVAANFVDASSSNCLGALLTANSACDTPNMIVTATTGNVPVFIMANINGISAESCVVANLGLVMDGQIIVASNIEMVAPTKTSVTMMSLQYPAPGSHTFEVQETDDTGNCDGSTFRTVVGSGSNTSSNWSTSTLIVLEF
jgi:trimeric autotransporter adhesin